MKNPLFIPGILLIGCTLSACQSSRYTASMSLEGNEKQSELSRTVSAAVALNSQSHEAFGKALTLVDRFLSSEGTANSDLYEELRDQVDECAKILGKVDPNLAELQSQSSQLFNSWSTELDQFSSQSMRSHSEQRLHKVQDRFAPLMESLQSTRDHMDTSLVALKDYVLFFNHNLSARGISNLRDGNEGFAAQVRAMAEKVDTAQRNADAFIVALNGAPTKKG